MYFSAVGSIHSVIAGHAYVIAFGGVNAQHVADNGELPTCTGIPLESWRLPAS